VHPLWLFQGHYIALREAIGHEIGEFSYRRLAADLRGLLVDSSPIGDAANRMFQLTVVFPVRPGVSSTELTMSKGGLKLNNLLLAGPLDVAGGATGPTEHISRDALLALPVIQIEDGSIFTLRDAIIAGANLAGGVHSSPRKVEGERLKPLAAALFGPGLKTGSELFVAAARCAISAYKHLFTLAEGASIGLAQPRHEHQPFMRLGTDKGEGGGAIEFAGAEFFEDGFPTGVSSPLIWIGVLALRRESSDQQGSLSPMVDRCIVDIGPPDLLGPRLTVIQRGRAILTRFTDNNNEVLYSPPLPLVDRRFYAVAAGVEEVDGGSVRVFACSRRGSSERIVERLGPPDFRMGDPAPSRMTLGSDLDRRKAKIGAGALMQMTTTLIFRSISKADIASTLERLSQDESFLRWIPGSVPEARIPMLYNQMRDEPAGG